MKCMNCKDTGLRIGTNGEAECKCGNGRSMYRHHFLVNQSILSAAALKNADELGGFDMGQWQHVNYENFLLKPHMERPIPDRSTQLHYGERDRILEFLKANDPLEFTCIASGKQMVLRPFWRDRLLAIFDAGEPVWIMRRA